MSDIDIPIYPLEQVLEVKRKRVEEALKVLNEKKRMLEKEEERLKQVIAEKEKVERHKEEKLKQLREILDKTTTTEEVQQSKAYLDVVNTKLRVEIEKVKKQENQVNIARVAFDEAKRVWEDKRKEVEKIEKHKESWLKEAYKEAYKEAQKISDEIGNTIFLTNQINKRM